MSFQHIHCGDRKDGWSIQKDIVEFFAHLRKHPFKPIGFLQQLGWIGLGDSNRHDRTWNFRERCRSILEFAIPPQIIDQSILCGSFKEASHLWIHEIAVDDSTRLPKSRASVYPR